MTPGVSMMKLMLLLKPPLMNNGRSLIAFVGTILPRFVPWVSSSGAVAATSTVWSIEPTVRITSKSRTLFTSTLTPAASAFRKPTFSVVTE